MEFRHNLRKLRTEKGLSQTQLATRAGLCKSAIRAYEEGYYSPVSTALRKIAFALGVTLEQLGKPPIMSRGPYRKRTTSQKQASNTNSAVPENKVKSCFNQKCLLNENCFCGSIIVVAGKVGCESQHKISDKPNDKEKILNTFRNRHGNYNKDGGSLGK